MDEKRKNPKNLRLSDDGEALLLALAKKLGLKQVGIVELALRRLAQAEGVTLEETPKKQNESGEDSK